MTPRDLASGALAADFPGTRGAGESPLDAGTPSGGSPELSSAYLWACRAISYDTRHRTSVAATSWSTR